MQIARIIESSVWLADATTSLHKVTKLRSEQNRLESLATEGDSPVVESRGTPADFSSSARPVEPGVNQRGPPRKAKYSLVTDSEE